MPRNIEERAMGYRTLIAIAALGSALLGCRENPQIKPRDIPIAMAAATGDDVEPLTNSDDEPILGQYVAAYGGDPVEVTLDGSGSTDRDGVIVTYRWLSATEDPDAGGRLVPGDEDSDWPADERRSRVQLDQGTWSFSLWVIDDEGLVSDPSSVTITVAGEDSAGCDPATCAAPALGAACCTSADTGAEADPRGRGPDLCGSDLGALIPTLAGICLQLNQPGDESAECPEIMATGGPEVGCCTDEGLCASINSSVPLGCHYPQAGPGGPCTP
jgi:hypothetical protein